jgi:competence protein ComEC
MLLVAGRLAAALSARRPVTAVSIGVLALVAIVVLIGALGAERAGHIVVGALLVVLAGGLVTFVGVLARLETFELGLIPRLVDEGGTVTMLGRVAVEPRRTSQGWQTVLAIHTLEATVTRERAVTLLETDLPLGTPVQIRASARPLPAGGYGRWLAQHHAVALLEVSRLEVTGPPGAWARASEWVRERIRSTAARHQAIDRAGLVVGFVTGDTRLLPEEDAAAMQATGLSHLTAVSGSNTAVLLAGIAGLLVLLRTPARVRWALLALAVPWFAFITRLEPSVLRAGVMALLVIAAAVHGVARDARHLLAGALVLLVLIDPFLSWSLGLMLSAGATLGVLVIAPRLATTFERIMPRAVAQLLGITVGAQLAVLPVLLAGFGTIELVTVPANLLAVPMAAAGASAAFIASALALVHEPIAASVFVVAGLPAEGVLRVARLFAGFGGAITLPEGAAARALAAGAAVVLLIAGQAVGGRSSLRHGHRL